MRLNLRLRDITSPDRASRIKVSVIRNAGDLGRIDHPVASPPRKRGPRSS